MRRVRAAFGPRPDARDVYERLYRRVYRQMYWWLRPLYEETHHITGYPSR